MFSCFRRKTAQRPDPESLRFVRAICDQHPQVTPTESWWAGYRGTFQMRFPDVEIEVTVNCVRNEWDMEIWCESALRHLYYYDCLSPKPTDAINFLVHRFNLTARVETSRAMFAEAESRRDHAAAAVKAKYLA